MIYLDYAATTPPAEAVLRAFTSSSKRYFANPNSTHAPGREAEAVLAGVAAAIIERLPAEGREIVFTSGATEANNLAIKGYALRHRSEGMHLLTSPFEHASVSAAFGYLAKLGFEVDVLETGPDGRVDPNTLRAALRPDTILVSIAAVASELGIVQPIAALADAVAASSRAAFMSDVTQAVGKIPVPFEKLGLATFSAHKFYGIKGVGALLRRPDLILEPLFHGGKSTTASRSGTPALSLAVSLDKALELALRDADVKLARVRELNLRLREGVASIPEIVVNSPADALPHILNLSVLTRDADEMVAFLDAAGICVSRQTACSSGHLRSAAVYHLTGDERRAMTSLRVSLSHLTTTEEIDVLLTTLSKGARP